MSLYKQYVCLVGTEGAVNDPPERVLSVMVMDGVGFFTINSLSDKEEVGPDEFEFQLPARGLLHVLTAAIAADEDSELKSTLIRLSDDLRERMAGRAPDGRLRRD